MKMSNLLGLLVVLSLLIAACGGGEDGAAETDAGADEAATTTTTEPEEEMTTTTAAATTTTTTAVEEITTTTAVEEMSGVHAAESDLGEILVGPDGFTLYIFTNDTGGESVCYDACAELWPPLPADTPIASDLDDSLFGTTMRDDGSEQLTVDGMPLYFYQPDSDPGDVEGQGFNGVWFVVDADGNVVEAAASDDDVVIDYDY